jgi:hypothetical protein
MVSTFCGNKMLSFAESKKKQIIKRDVRTIKWELCNVRCQTAAIENNTFKTIFFYIKLKFDVFRNFTVV